MSAKIINFYNSDTENDNTSQDDNHDVPMPEVTWEDMGNLTKGETTD
jgi:hypothetical protein